MPKRNSYLPSERERLEFLREAFEEVGELNKSQLFQKLNARFPDCDFNESMRTVYRDLSKLIDNEKFIKPYIETDEDTLTDATGESIRGKAQVWKLTRIPDKFIPGLKLLQDLGGELTVTEERRDLQNSILIDESLEASDKSHHFLFPAGHKLLHLKIIKEAVPFRLFIARRLNDDPYKILNILKNWESPDSGKVSSRNILLRLPIATISAFRDKERVGHCVIDVAEKSTTIGDLHSKNGTSYCEFDQSALENILKNPGLIKAKTSTNFWSPKELEAFKYMKLEVSKIQAVRTPCMIQASKELSVLTY